MAILPVGIGPQEGGYQIERSLRFNSADSAYLSRTPASAGNRKTWTWSAWVKRSALSSTNWLMTQAAGSGLVNDGFFLSSGMSFYWNFQGSGGAVSTSAVFRDASAWYHIVVKFDTTQATSTDRIVFYVNGVQQAQTGSYPAQNYDGYINSAAATDIGRLTGDTYFSGYMTEVNFIDGQALDPTSFGEYNSETGVWQPKEYTGSYGTNGFYLDFADNSSTTALGYDAAGSNDWTPNNFSVTAGAGNDSLVDTPTPYGTDTGAGGEVRGNYCVMNPLDKGSSATVLNGNLTVTNAFTGSPYPSVRGTFGVSSGKWYWEINCTTVNGDSPSVGVANAAASMSDYLGIDANSWAYILYTGAKANSGNTGQTYGASVSSGDIVGVALDMNAGTITFYKNGTSQGQAFSGITGTIFPASFAYNNSVLEHNFGQRPFAYTAPTGFKALCTTNLEEPAIADGSQYMDVLTWSNGVGQHQSPITGLNFQPDFVWIKGRDTGQNHVLTDAVRGVTKTLQSNVTDAEVTVSQGLTAFNSDGFSLGDDLRFNPDERSIVAWSWKAGGTGVSNAAGSITSTVSANTTAGFSIATYTGNGSAGATFGHGLGAAPSFVIVKERGNTNGWLCYHISTGNTGYLELDATLSFQTLSTVWNNTSPTSTLVTLGTVSNVNRNGGTYVAYCFAPVAGYSAFGSYTGNGSSDGPMIFTGFKPAFVLIKSSSYAAPWVLHDATRNTYNVVNLNLTANTSNAEGTYDQLDFLSNGFKLRNTGANLNTSGGTLIYAAFASNPFKHSLAV